jgi:uncharacterized protein (DUF2235 family)
LLVILRSNHFTFGLTNHCPSEDTEGDRISIFGFSRGAYAAQALTGMLHKVWLTYRLAKSRHAWNFHHIKMSCVQVGLLPAYNHVQVPYAYEMFKRNDPEGWRMSNGFKRAFSVNVEIDFVGVFDTVSGVGEYAWFCFVYRLI